MSADQLLFRLKLGDKDTRIYGLETVLDKFIFADYIKHDNISGILEICITNSYTKEVTKFLMDSRTFKIRLNINKNGVVFSQYGIDIYEILAVDGDDHNRYYSICAEKLMPTSKQNKNLVIRLFSNEIYFYVKFKDAPETVKLLDSEEVFFTAAPTKMELSELKSFLTSSYLRNVYFREYPGRPWRKVTFLHLRDAEPLEIRDENDQPIELITYMEFVNIASGPASFEVRVVAESFKAKLTYSGKVQSTLILEYICRCASLYGADGTSMYAPYGVLYQSSGFGKSRGVCEVGKRLSTIYGVFRKDADTGYPKQTAWLSKLRTKICEVKEVDFPYLAGFTIMDYRVGRVLIFLKCMIEAYIQWMQELLDIERLGLGALCFPENGVINLESRDVVKVCEVYEKIMDYFIDGTPETVRFGAILDIKWNEWDIKSTKLDNLFNDLDQNAKKFKRLNELVFRKRNELDQIEWSSFIATHFSGQTDHHQIWPKIEHKSFPFVVVLDEASVLSETAIPGEVSLLSVIRRALHLIPPTDSFVVVSLGTNCDVSTLNKPVSDDSLRITTRPNLMYPMIATGNWDIHFKESKLQDLVVDARLLKNRRTLLLKYSFGRALWNALHLKTLIGVAQAKIRNGSRQDDYLQWIAIWCIRAGLTVNANSRLSEKLLKSHMATLLSTSSGADRILVNYSAEPALAIAAEAAIKSHKVDYFKSLLKFVEGVPTDRGKIGETIFNEVLLEGGAVGVSNIETHSDTNPAGASDRVKQLLNSKEYLLEIFNGEVGSGGGNSEDQSGFSVDDICKQHFRIKSVQEYLEGVYSADVFRNIKPFLSETLLNGIMNLRQFVSLHRDFPYKTFLGRDYEELSDASMDGRKKCNIFDKAMSKLGLLKDVAFICPPGYYGLDAFIPVLIEVDVEVRQIPDARTGQLETVVNLHDPNRTALPRARTAREMDDDDEVVIEKRSVLSYIGLQYKVGYADKTETLSKTAPLLHLNGHMYEPWELEAVEKNHLVLVLSSYDDIETPILSAVNEGAAFNGPFRVSHFNADAPQANEPTADAPQKNQQNADAPQTNQSTADAPQTNQQNAPTLRDTIKQCFHSVPEEMLDFERVDQITKVRFAKNVPEPKGFTSIKISKHVTVCGMYWSPGKQITCIWSSSLLAFRSLMEPRVLDLAHQIMRSDRPVFTDHVDAFVRKSLADATVNTQTGFFPNSDPMLRAFRGHEPLPPIITDFSHWKEDLSVDLAPNISRPANQ